MFHITQAVYGSSWFNSEGKFYNWTGNIFQSIYRDFTFSAGSAKLGFVKLTQTSFQLVNSRLDVLRADYKIDDNFKVYATVGSAIAYFGFDYKKSIGIYARVSAFSIGGTGGPIGARIDIGSIGYAFAFEKAKLEVSAAVLFWYSISIDFVWIYERVVPQTVEGFLEVCYGGQ